MLDVSPLWPADLDHIRVDTPDPAALARFYAAAMGMDAARRTGRKGRGACPLPRGSRSYLT